MKQTNPEKAEAFKLIFEIMSIRKIGIRELMREFLRKKVRNYTYNPTLLDGITEDLTLIKIENIKDHPDLFGDDATGDENAEV